MGNPLRQRTPKPPPQRRGTGLGAVLVLALILMVGIHLGALSWRYRKEIWQLQGAAVGLVVGYLLAAAGRKP